MINVNVKNFADGKSTDGIENVGTEVTVESTVPTYKVVIVATSEGFQVLHDDVVVYEF